MPSDRSRPTSLSASRMEAFSDGVFGIAATLLVLEITLHPPGSPLEQLLHAWPSYLGYVVSFLTIGAAWLGHSVLTARLSGADSLLLRINLILLLVIAFLPFPTRLVSEALHDVESERVFITLYGLTLLTIRLLQLALDAYAAPCRPLRSNRARPRKTRSSIARCSPSSSPTWPRSSSALPCPEWRSCSTSASPCTSSCQSARSDGLCSDDDDRSDQAQPN